jgi:hypothetical protein
MYIGKYINIYSKHKVWRGKSESFSYAITKALQIIITRIYPNKFVKLQILEFHFEGDLK